MHAKILIETEVDVFLKVCHGDDDGNHIAILSDEPFQGNDLNTIELLHATLFIDGMDCTDTPLHEYITKGEIRLLKVTPSGEWIT